MIRVRDLVKRHGEWDVLRGVSLDVRRGEVAAIVGPSGGGKSTFLRCLNGLERFEGGSVEVAGLRLEVGMVARARELALREIRRRVGMVFQAFHLFPHRSALANVAEGPRYVLKLPKGEAEARARTLLEKVGMGDRLEARPSQLSGGQQQRVAIARALAMGPEVLLFDEPTSALDPPRVEQLHGVLAGLAAEGQTIVVVTHDVPFARRVADTVHVLEEGRVVASGPPAEILGRIEAEPKESGEIRGSCGSSRDRPKSVG